MLRQRRPPPDSLRSLRSFAAILPRNDSPPVVHDAANNQTWEIPLANVTILGAHGRSIIYSRTDSAGKAAVYMAEIVLP